MDNNIRHIPLPIIDSDAYARRKVIASETSTQKSNQNPALYYKVSHVLSEISHPSGDTIVTRHEHISRNVSGDHTTGYRPYVESVYIGLWGKDETNNGSVYWNKDQKTKNETLSIESSDGILHEMRLTNGNASYHRITMGDGIETSITRDAFIIGASSAVGAHLQEWTTDLGRMLPIGKNVAHTAIPTETLINSTHKLNISTNGTCSIITAPHHPTGSAFHQGEAIISPQTIVQPTSFSPDTVYGTRTNAPDVIDGLKNDAMLQKSLSPEIRAQLTKALQNGAIIAVDHTNDGTLCAAAGLKPSSLASKDTSKQR